MTFERVACEFFLIRYVPDVVKGEFVNIGVLLREAAGEGGTVRTSQVRFTRDWNRVRCMDADATLGCWKTWSRRLRRGCAPGVSARDPKGVLEVLEDSLSNSVQLTEPRATLAESLVTEMEQLMRLYVEPLKVARVKAKTGRASIQASLRREFERTGGVVADAQTRSGCDVYAGRGPAAAGLRLPFAAREGRA